jgi:hypothetical protein
VIRLLLAGAVLTVALYFGSRWLAQAFAGLAYFREETTLAVLVVLGAVVYGLTVLLLLGRSWFGSLLKDVGTAADAPASKLPEPPDPTSSSSSLPDNTPPPTV